MTSASRLYVLDTNVLIHDPRALFRFAEHDVYLPMVVIEELDRAKKGMSEIARSSREVSRMLDELLRGSQSGGDAIALPADDQGRSGRLFLQIDAPMGPLPAGLSPDNPDNRLLGILLGLRGHTGERETVLVSKDTHLRIKAQAMGLAAEDYSAQQAIDDPHLLHGGTRLLDQALWSRNAQAISTTASGRFMRIDDPGVARWNPCEFVLVDGRATIGIVRETDDAGALVELLDDADRDGDGIWGITPRNLEQRLALRLLLDPSIDFVTLLGQAGTGKTLLALAAGLAQSMEQQRFTEIIVTRATVPVGDDIGYLPGTEEEKMGPWMGALEDNLDVLLPDTASGSGAWARSVTHDLVRERVKIKSLSFMRGRTFANRYIIIDEAQNLTPHQIKTLVTRAGADSKVVCLGNLAQIDTPYVTETTSGLTYAVERFRPWRHAGHITLRKVERSRLADYAAEAL